MAFRLFAGTMWLALAAYTVAVIARDGIGYAPVFIAAIAAMGWPGQFNLDFLAFDALAALWVAWRARFAARGWLLAFFAFNLGALFILPYLIRLSVRHDGDGAAMLLGTRLPLSMG